MVQIQKMQNKFFALCISLLFTSRSLATIDYLDTTFGSNANGIVQTAIGTTAEINGTAIDSNGNVVVAGTTTISGVQKVVVARYTSSGSLDTSFNPAGNTNAAGIVTVLPTSASGASAAAVIVDSSNNVLVTGTATISGSSNIFIARLKNADGSLDSTFGTGGIVTFNIGDLSGANSIVHDSSGKIYVTGFTNTGGTISLFIARFTTIGGVDTSWGTSTGYTVVSVGANAAGNSVTIDGNANIVVGGTTSPNFLVVRFVGTTGLLDSTFGTGGVVTTSNGGSVQAVAIDSSNRIVACGYVPSNSFALARYNTNGTLDTTFGPSSTGLVTTSIGVNSQIFGAVIDSNSNINVSGVSDTNVATARYTSNGSLDTTFGPSNSGIITTSVGLGAQANSLAIQSDGRLVAGGLYVIDETQGTEGLSLIRYNKNNTDFINTTSIGDNSTIKTKIPNVSGTSSAASATVQVVVNGTVLTTTSTDGSGNWNAGNTNVLTPGTNTIQVNLIVSSVTVVSHKTNFTVVDVFTEDDVFAFNSTTQTRTGTTLAFATLPFDNFVPGTGFSNGTTWQYASNVFTCNKTGRYSIQYIGHPGATAVGTGETSINIATCVTVNGTEYIGSEVNSNIDLLTNLTRCMAKGFFKDLNAGDTVSLNYGVKVNGIPLGTFTSGLIVNPNTTGTQHAYSLAITRIG